MEIQFIGEKTIRITRDQTILEASLHAEIPHFHACGGRAKCSTCRILVIEGIENVSPINVKEARLRKSMTLPSNTRLACQTKILKEPVKVERIMKDENDISLHFKLDKVRAKEIVSRKPLGEEKHLVLFFLDIRNFTQFVEAYLPFDVIHVLHRLFKIFHRVLTTNRGQIVEISGDQIYAVFGLRTSIKEAADDAILAGKSILDELDNFNEAYLGFYFFKQFEIGIGIHSGKVIVGEFDLGNYKKTSVMGLAVNIASRIQNSTKEVNNSFVISDEALKISSFVGESKTALVRLKGISALFNVHLVGKPYAAQTI